MCNHLRMEPFGDPEARIRDLERPLADRANASEMGTRPYEVTSSANVPVPPPYPYPSPPPPPPPPLGASPPYGYESPPYPSPYYAPPQRVVHKRTHVGWIAPLVVVVIAVIGTGVALVWFNVVKSTTSSPIPNPPGISGGGGPVDSPQLPEIEIPDIEVPGIPSIELPIGPSDEVLTVEAGSSVSIAGVDRQQRVVCNQGAVSVSGMNNTVEITGACESVTVSGMENVVTVDSAATITASGFDNRVTYRQGTPEVSKSGNGNIVEQG